MKRIFSIFAMAFAAFIFTAQAQTTAFNFQGRLNDGTSPANGRYDLQFLLYDALVGGNQVCAIEQKPNTVLINGVFSTQLNFSCANAFTGGDRFLEIQLKPAGSTNAYVILGARQQLLSVPYAVKSLNSTNAVNATNATNATTAADSQQLGGVAAANYLQKNGDGSQLTNVTAVNSQQLGGVSSSEYIRRGSNGNIALFANVTQPLLNNGLPKAIVRLDRNGAITFCYNAVTGTSTGNCGFTTDHPTLGNYGVDFGFNVSNRVINITPEADGSDVVVTQINRQSATLNQVVVDVVYRGSGNLTNAPLDIIVY